MARNRVLLAEDFEEVAEQLCALLQASDFDVVATVGNGYDLVAQAKSRRPDVIVADISMPGLDGLSATVRLLGDVPDLPVVFVSVHSDSEIVRRAMEVGAMGYVSKLTAGEDLVPAVRAALKRQRYVSAVLSVSAAQLAPPVKAGAK